MAKSNLPLTLTGERIEFQRLYDLTGTEGRNMTTSGAYSFTSLSSGTVYSTSSGGEYAVFLQLQTALENYDIGADDFNNKAEQSAVTAVANDLASHTADNVYQVAGGTATAITLTINGTLVDGYPLTFIASEDNGGQATTINTKPVYKPNTTDAPTFVTGKAYTVWYDQTGDNFFIKASAEGTAVADQVLAGETFSNDNDTGLVGAMPNNGIVEIEPEAADIPLEGYYANGSKVNAIEILTLSAGDTAIVTRPGEAFSYAEYTKAGEIRLRCAGGNVRVYFGIRCDSGPIVYARIYINGEPRGIERSNSTGSWLYFSEDFAVNKDDLIQLYVKGDLINTGSFSVRVQSVPKLAEITL